MRSIIIQNNQEMTKIMVSDIYYIIAHPSRPHYLQVMTGAGEYDLAEKLKNLEALFPNELVRCHRNCLVSISKIKSVNLEKKVVVLGEDGQHQVAFSRRRYHDIRNKWLEEGER